MFRPIHAWIAIAALSVGAAGAAPLQLTEAEQAALDACFEIEDEKASIACVAALGLPLPPEMAQALATANDPDVQAAHEDWQAGFDAAMVEQARTLAARGDARSLLAAAMIVPMDYDDAGQPLPSAVDPNVWFDAARRASPADPLVAWVEATSCWTQAFQCDADAATARLLRVDGDNAAVQWLAINAALEEGDEIAARTHLRLAAQADRFEPYNREALAMLLDARGTASPPPLDTGTARLLQMNFGLDRLARNEDIIGMTSTAQWAAMGLAPMARVLELCRTPVERSQSDPALRQDCIGFMTRVAVSGSMIIFRSIALPLLIELDNGSGQAHWQASLREHAWQYEQFSDLLRAGGQGATVAGMDTHAHEIAADGELGAIRHVLELNGVALQPPAGWLPAHPRYRALITTGQAPAS